MKMSMTFLAWKTAILTAIVASAIFPVSAADDPTNYTLSEPKKFSAAPGETNVYSGIISGSSYAIVEGGGTVVFSNSGNTYSGGTLVSNAVFRLDANGCAGSGAITAAVSSAHIFMNCTIVPNDLYFAEGYSTGKTDLKPGEYPADNAIPLFSLVESATVSGKVYFKKTSRYIPNRLSDTQTVIFENDVSTASNAELSLYAYGTTIFNGKLSENLVGNNILMGGASTATGTIVFNSQSNLVKKLATYNGNFTLNARDALPETLVFIRNSRDRSCSIFDLNGNDQTFSGVIWYIGSSAPPVTPYETSSGFRFRTAEGKPATMRLTGTTIYKTDTTNRNYMALSGPLTLVMDILPARTTDGFFQEFSLRKSETTGDLVISNGDFRVTDGASFPNVPNIYVGSGGTFSSAATTNAFAGCRSLVVDGTMAFGNDVKTPFTDGKVALSLGSSANLTLPSGYTLTVPSLKVGGEIKADGTYGDGGLALAQISRGTVIVRSSDRYVDCNTADTVNDGSKAHPYKTIRAATDNALSGDVIHVAPGTYGAAEGSQSATEASMIGTRVVIPEDVTIESTDGPEATFIVGAAATGDQIDIAKYGTGTNAVRCVYANDGAVLRGFTLTGGRAIGVLAGDGGDWTVNHDGAAFRAPKTRTKGVTIESCIVSNNIAYVATIAYSTVRNCRVFGNGVTRGGSKKAYPAGYNCMWYGSVIDRNVGNAAIGGQNSSIDSCTIGSGNVQSDGSDYSAQVIGLGSSGTILPVINTAILGGRYDLATGAYLYCTNCLLADNSYLNDWPSIRELAYNCIITNSAAMQVEANTYRPILGSFAGIDAGDAAYSSEALGDRDLYDTPRVLNAQIDIGAVEYDWRPVFAQAVGKRLTITDASPSVTTNAAGGLLIPSGALAGTVAMGGYYYSFTFAISGGTLEAFVGDASAGVYSAGEQTITLEIPNSTTEFRFVFTPDAETPGAAILRQLVSNKGFVISFR